jgi:hypothetical protein
MTPNKKKIIWYSLLGLLVVGAGVGYYAYREYTRKNLNPENVKPEITTTSQELYQSFASDSIAAKKKFAQKDEVVEVSGVVSGVTENQDKQTIILLKTNDSSASVNCTMEGNAKTVKVNDNIRLKGFCMGMGSGDADLGITADLYMIRCYINK